MELFQDGRINFRSETDATKAARVWGRSRSSQIIAVHVEEVGDEIWLEGVGVRGTNLAQTGFRLLAEELDEVCEAWLAARGKCVTTPDVIERSLLYRLL